METIVLSPHAAQRYARAVEVSKRVRFDIDRDVIRAHALEEPTPVSDRGREDRPVDIVGRLWPG